MLYIHTCSYKNMLGEVGKGIHSYRLFDIAMFDVLLTILAAGLFRLCIFPKISFVLILFAFFCLGIFFHRIFCVRTTIDKLIFS